MNLYEISETLSRSGKLEGEKKVSFNGKTVRISVRELDVNGTPERIRALLDHRLDKCK